MVTPLVVLSAGLVVALSGVAPAAAAPGETLWVAESDIQSITASEGWAVDFGIEAGDFAVEAAPASVDMSLKLQVANPSQQMTVQYRYGSISEMPRSTAADDFATLRSMLSDARFTAQGDAAANFQVNVIYRPVDAARYGTTGTHPCAATGIDDWCYTTLKYEPTTFSVTTLTAYDVSQTLDDGLVPPGQSGWWRSQRVGEHPRPGGPDDVSLNQMLAQMSELRVFAFGVSLGSGSPGSTVYVHDLSFAGNTYRFGAHVVIVNAPLAVPLQAAILVGILLLVPASLALSRRRAGRTDGVERIRVRSTQGGV